MTEKQALQYSISHWLWDNIEPSGHTNFNLCALCSKIMFRDFNDCQHCILGKYWLECVRPDKEEEQTSKGTPYGEAMRGEEEEFWNMVEVLIYIHLSEYDEMPILEDVRPNAT